MFDQTLIIILFLFILGFQNSGMNPVTPTTSNTGLQTSSSPSNAVLLMKSTSPNYPDGSPQFEFSGSSGTDFCCNVCHKNFSRSDILKKHLKSHISSNCTICGETFQDKLGLAKHQMEVSFLNIYTNIYIYNPIALLTI